MPLSSNSPAVDNANNIDCPITDQLGEFRSVDGDVNGVAVCDIGAYELQLCEGDFDGDGDVDGSDLTLFSAELGSMNCTTCQADFDGDEDVDGTDLSIFSADFGRMNCPVQQM